MILYPCSASDEDISEFIPYWDWTSRTGIPELAVNYDEWRQGPIKESASLTIRAPDVATKFDETTRRRLFLGTVMAFCQKRFSLFDFHIQAPHNMVHEELGGNMRDADYASYDPIFYLHHMNVDRQYAYYQALQRARGRSVTLPDSQNIEMPPFSGKIKGAIEDLNIPNPNPIKSTRDYSTPNSGLDYEKTFQYKYDSLTFEGISPQNFDANFQCPPPITLDIILNGSKRSINNIFANIRKTTRERRSTEVKKVIFGKYVILKEQSSNTLLNIDLTPSYKQYDIPFDDNTIHFTVESYDFDNNIIKNNAFKPTVTYASSDGEIVMSYHTDYFTQYNPNVSISNLRTKVAFWEKDGTFSDEVSLKGDRSEPVTEPIQITSTKHEFWYSEHKIVLGLNLNEFLEVSFTV